VADAYNLTDGTTGMNNLNLFTASLGSIEKLIYFISAVMLSAAAFVVFGQAVYQFYNHIIIGEIAQAVIRLLENILLALMMAELLHTLMVSIQAKGLIPEPFLIVALVAAVRRILAISVEGSHFIDTNMEKFSLLLIEIGVLAAFILILVISIYILRKRQPLTDKGKTDRTNSALDE
jgi:hypothetical protein